MFNPLDDLGLPRALVAEIWASNAPKEERIAKLIDLANRTVRAYAKILASDITGVQSPAFTAMTDAREMFEPGSVASFVNWWLDPKDIERVKATDELQRKVDIAANRLSVVGQMLLSIDQRSVSGVSGDLELVLATTETVDSPYPTALYLLRLKGNDSQLLRLSMARSPKDVAQKPSYTEIKRVDDRWCSLQYEKIYEAPLPYPLNESNPLSVRLVGGVGQSQMLEIAQELYPTRRLRNNAVAAEGKALAHPTTAVVGEPDWFTIENTWWIGGIEATLTDATFAVLAKANAGEVELTALRIVAMHDAS